MRTYRVKSMPEDELLDPPKTVRELGIEFRGFVNLTKERRQTDNEKQDAMIKEISRLAEALERANDMKADKEVFNAHVMWGEEAVKDMSNRVTKLENWKEDSDKSFSTKIKKMLVDKAALIVVTIIIGVFIFALVKFSQPQSITEVIGK